MDSPNPLDGGRVGNLLGLGASPASSTAATPVDKKVKRKKNLESQRTYRFDLTLKSCETNGKEYDEFNWLDLIAADEESRADQKRQEFEAQMQKSRKASTNPLDPYASDDEEQLKAMARKFEAKYGGAADKIKKKKKERKLNDLADLGYGYDSNDSFIDNSEAHDEVVPTNITTAHGGFYINTGNLEFKARESADDDSDLEAVYQEGEKAAAAKKRRRKRMKNGVDSSDAVGGTPSKKARTDGANGSDGSATDSSSKQRMRREGSKPLGRPKMRNPGGTLVHPPKPPRQPKVDVAGQPVVRKKLPTGQQVKVRRVNKVLPPGSKNLISAEEDVVKINKILNGSEGSKERPIDLTASAPASSEPSPPSSTPRSSAPVQLKTVETSPNSMIQDQLVGDSTLRMIASTLSESKVTITPTSRYSQAENVTKGNGNDTKKPEATLIATKKAPSAKTEANEMAKFFQSLANATMTAQQPQQPARQSADKNSEKSVPNQMSPPKQALQQQKKLQQKKQQQQVAKASGSGQQQRLQQQEKLKRIYQDFYDKMQSALRRGDNGEYNRLVESLKDVMDAQGQAHAVTPPAKASSALKQTKARGGESLSSEASKVAKSLPSGITIQSVSLASKTGGDSVDKKPTPKSSVTLTATKVATIESSKTTTNKPSASDVLVTSSKMNTMVTVSTVQAKTVSANISVVSKTGEQQQQPSSLSVLQRQASSNSLSQEQSYSTNLPSSTTIQPTKPASQFMSQQQEKEKLLQQQQLQQHKEKQQQLMQQQKEKHQQMLQQQKEKQQQLLQQQKERQQMLQQQKEQKHQEMLLKQQQLKLQKEKQLQEHQKQLELQKEKQLQQQMIEQQKQLQQQKLLEQQKQLELQREKQMQEQQKQLELQREKQLQQQLQEQQKQLELQLQKEKQLEQQRQMEKQRQIELQREKQLQQQLLEQQKQLELQLQKDKERQLQQQHQMQLQKEKLQQDSLGLLLSSSQQQTLNLQHMSSPQQTSVQQNYHSLSVQQQQPMPKVLGYGTKISSSPLPSMSSPTPSMSGLTVNNANQVLASMQPQPPVDYSNQFTPPKGPNQARTANMYGTSTQSPTASSNRASPVATSNISSSYCSSQMSANQTLNRSTGISPTGYAKVMPHSSMSISLSSAASPTPQTTSTLHQSPTSITSSSYGLQSPSVTKTMGGYFAASQQTVSVSLPTVPVPSSASNISHQLTSNSGYQYFTSPMNASPQQHPTVVIPSILKSPVQQQQQQQPMMMTSVLKSPSQQQQQSLQQQQQLLQQQKSYYGLNN